MKPGKLQSEKKCMWTKFNWSWVTSNLKEIKTNSRISYSRIEAAWLRCQYKVSIWKVKGKFTEYSKSPTAGTILYILLLSLSLINVSTASKRLVYFINDNYKVLFINFLNQLSNQVNQAIAITLNLKYNFLQTLL